MAKFNYKKWIAENKHGKNNTWESLYEQGVADFEVKEQTSGSGTTGSNTGSGTTGGSTGSGTTGGSTGSGTTGSNTGSGTTGGSTGSGTTGSNTGSGTAMVGCTNPQANNYEASATVACDGTNGSGVAGPNNCVANQTGTNCCCEGVGNSAGSGSSGVIGMYNGNYYGLPFNQQPCIFNYNGVAAQTYLNTGNAPSWNGWLSKRQDGYVNVGCRHFTNVTKWISNQLSTGVNAAGNPWNNIQIARKNEKISWANSMWDNCQCTQPGGSLPEELGRTYKINENKINIPKKLKKSTIKKIIKEELENSLNKTKAKEDNNTHSSTTESQRLREEIQKELFGKKGK